MQNDDDDDDPEDTVYFSAVVHPPATDEGACDDYRKEDLEKLVQYFPETDVSNQHIEGTSGGKVLHGWMGSDRAARCVGAVSGKGGLQQELIRTCLLRGVFNGTSLNQLSAWKSTGGSNGDGVSYPLGAPTEIALLPLKGAYRGPACCVEAVLTKDDLRRYTAAEIPAGINIQDAPGDVQTPERELARLVLAVKHNRRMADKPQTQKDGATLAGANGAQVQTDASTTQSEATPMEALANAPSKIESDAVMVRMIQALKQSKEEIEKKEAAMKEMKEECERLKKQASEQGLSPMEEDGELDRLMSATAEAVLTHLKAALPAIGTKRGSKKANELVALMGQFKSETDAAKKKKLMEDMKAHRDDLVLVEACSAPTMELAKKLQIEQRAKEAAEAERATLRKELDQQHRMIYNAASVLLNDYSNPNTSLITDRVRPRADAIGETTHPLAQQPPAKRACLESAPAVQQPPKPAPSGALSAVDNILAQFDGYFAKRLTAEIQPLPTDVEIKRN